MNENGDIMVGLGLNIKGKNFGGKLDKIIKKSEEQRVIEPSLHCGAFLNSAPYPVLHQVSVGACISTITSSTAYMI